MTSFSDWLGKSCVKASKSDKLNKIFWCALNSEQTDCVSDISDI